MTPAQNLKELVIVTTSAAAASDTIDVDGKIDTIYGVSINGADGAAVASGSWSGTVITIPATAATGVKYIRVWGAN